MSFELTKEQIVAEQLIKYWFTHESRQMFVLSGYAGTGKTTLLMHVVDSLGLVPGLSAVYVTPTGKAATVLIQSGIAAMTLHRLIYQPRSEEETITLDGRQLTVTKLTFTRREYISQDIKLIILDEASMVSDDVLRDIANFQVKVLVCGDGAQLPPVEGSGNILEHPDFTLRQIVRQQEDNPIIKLAQAAKDGKRIEYGNYYDMAFVVSRSHFSGERRKRYLLRAGQVICGKNITRNKINDEIRSYLGYGPLPQNGDKLICTYNNWNVFIDEKNMFNLVNGIIGICENPVYYPEKNIVFLNFRPDFLPGPCPDVLACDTGIFTDGVYRYKAGDFVASPNDSMRQAVQLNRFEYGYCISCHKAQGSEFDSVIVLDESYAFCEDRNRWLYTAITRARKKLIIVK